MKGSEVDIPDQYIWRVVKEKNGEMNGTFPHLFFVLLQTIKP